ILEENGISYDKVIKTTCFLADINDFIAFNEIYAEFFKDPYPARSAFAVKDLPKKAKVEIEIIAQKG
ncbi:Rid family hydrolase, partial [Campylobacter jejuni]